MERGYKVPSKIDLLYLGTKCSERTIETFEDLEKESQLFFNEEEFEKVDFVKKPLTDIGAFESCLMKYDYSETLSGQAKLRGSAL